MDDLTVALTAARAGAEVLRRWTDRDLQTEFKGAGNPVTAADREAEAAVVAVLGEHRPNDGILAEEGSEAAVSSGRLWVIDPLDGTVNFLHGLGQSAVSIALGDDEGASVAVTIDPFRDEEFTATRGGGAFCNGRPLRVSGCATLDEALLVTGFAYDRRDHGRSYTDAVAAVLAEAQGVRRLGSACLDLAWVACGRYEGHWEWGLAPWDLAAGVLLVTEAGGRVSDSYGDEVRPEDVVASNGLIHDDLLRILAAHRPAHHER